jgi:hypothetical protein
MNWKGCTRKRSWPYIEVLSQYLRERTEKNVHDMDIYYIVPYEACFVGEVFAATNEGISTTQSKERLENYWRGRKSSGLRTCTRCRWYGYSNCSCRTHHTAMLDTYSAACTRRTLVWDSVLRVSVCSLPHPLLEHFSSYVVCHRRANNTGVPVATIRGVKHAFVRRATLIPLRAQPYSCCTITMGFIEN